MSRLIPALLAVGATLLTAGVAVAAPKAAASAEKVCVAGVGKPVCCKAYVANHCMYVSCCEVGNHGFFKQTACAKCEANRAARATDCGDKSACSPDAAVAGTGNGAFFGGVTPVSGGSFPTSRTRRTPSAKSARRAAAATE